MTDPTCARCGARLLEYRGAWFGPGDETTCPAGDRHAPAPIVDDRASIVAFLTAEALNFTHAADFAGDDDPDARQRLDSKASLLRTMATHVARGDDRLGGGQ